MFRASLVDGDSLGIQARREGDLINYGFPVAVLVAAGDRPHSRGPRPMKIIDLSFPIRPHFRWAVAREIRSSHARGDNFESSVMTLACHAYTHVDAPRHFLPDDRAITDMPIDQWIGEAAVVDLTHLGRNGEVSAAELDKRAGHVRAGDIALLAHGLAVAHERGRRALLARRPLHRPRAPASGWWRAG